MHQLKLTQTSSRIYKHAIIQSFHAICTIQHCCICSRPSTYFTLHQIFHNEFNTNTNKLSVSCRMHFGNHNKGVGEREVGPYYFIILCFISLIKIALICKMGWIKTFRVWDLSFRSHVCTILVSSIIIHKQWNSHQWLKELPFVTGSLWKSIWHILNWHNAFLHHVLFHSRVLFHLNRTRRLCARNTNDINRTLKVTCISNWRLQQEQEKETTHWYTTHVHIYTHTHTHTHTYKHTHIYTHTHTQYYIQLFDLNILILLMPYMLYLGAWYHNKLQHLILELGNISYMKHIVFVKNVCIKILVPPSCHI